DAEQQLALVRAQGVAPDPPLMRPPEIPGGRGEVLSDQLGELVLEALLPLVRVRKVRGIRADAQLLELGAERTPGQEDPEREAYRRSSHETSVVIHRTRGPAGRRVRRAAPAGGGRSPTPAPSTWSVEREDVERAAQ